MRLSFLLLLKKYYENTGKKPDFHVFASGKSSLPSPSTYKRYFGSWTEAKKIAGFEPDRTPKPKINSKELKDKQQWAIGELRRLSDLLGKSPGKRDCKRILGFSEKRISSLFGGWDKAKMAAGLTPSNMYNANKKDVIDSFISYVEEFNHIPGPKDFIGKTGLVNPQKVRTLFGSWADASIESGYIPSKGLKLIHINLITKWLLKEFPNLNKEQYKSIYEQRRNENYPHFATFERKSGKSFNDLVIHIKSLIDGGKSKEKIPHHRRLVK